jgi:hypothetical protein
MKDEGESPSAVAMVSGLVCTPKQLMPAVALQVDASPLLLMALNFVGSTSKT